MAFPAAEPDSAFATWVTQVAEILRRHHGVVLDRLDWAPLELGFESGDSPAEFVAGALAPQLAVE